MEFFDIVKEVRQATGLSQEDLARALDVSLPLSIGGKTGKHIPTS